MKYTPPSTELHEIRSYQASILHARAYRQLKEAKNAILKKHGLTMMQWSVLGLIYDSGEAGTRISDVASQLDTTNAFVTTTVNLLEAKELVTRADHDTDRRAKLVRVNPQHEDMIEEMERDVRQELRESIYSRVSRAELATFIKVIAAFAGDGDLKK